MKKTSNTVRWLGLALACGTLTFAVTTQAGKPVKPPSAIEPGIVFYAQEGYVKVANSDDSGIQNLFAVVGRNEYPRLSDLPHGSGYWFLTERSDGSELALIAITENGTQVRLSTGPDVKAASYTSLYATRWLVGDSKVAFIGIVPDLSTETNLATGIYLMDIDWSSGQPVAAGAPQLLDWTVPIVSGSGTYGGCDFSADGSTIYFSSGGDLFKADVATGTAVGLLASQFGSQPELSTDGSKLVGYGTPNGVQTINADGTGLTTVVPTSGVMFYSGFDCGIFAFWSPTGQNIVFTHEVSLNKRLNSMSEQVTIVSASGNVLGTVGAKAQFTTTLGWRPAR
jgi:Tol biopolymer transport system component